VKICKAYLIGTKLEMFSVLDCICCDVIRVLLLDWIGNVKDFTALDIAISNKSTRTKYQECLKKFGKFLCPVPFHLSYQFKHSFPQFLLWCSQRFVYVQELHIGYQITYYPDYNPTASDSFKYLRILHIHANVFAQECLSLAWLLDTFPTLLSLHITCDRVINVLKYPLQLDQSLSYFPKHMKYPLQEFHLNKVNFPFTVQYLDEFLTVCPSLHTLQWYECNMLQTHHLLQVIRLCKQLVSLEYRRPSLLVLTEPETIHSASVSFDSILETNLPNASCREISCPKLEKVCLQGIKNAKYWLPLFQLLCPALPLVITGGGGGDTTTIDTTNQHTITSYSSS